MDGRRGNPKPSPARGENFAVRETVRENSAALPVNRRRKKRDRAILAIAFIRMPEQLLGCFDVYSFLPQHRSKAVAERMPSDSLSGSAPFQCRSDVTPENHVKRDGFLASFTVFGSTRELIEKQG